MNRFALTAAGALVAFSVAAPAWAQIDDQAKALLTDSSAAIKNLPGLTFKSKRSLDGAAQLAMKGESSVRFVRNQGNAPASSFWVQGEMLLPMSKDPSKVDTLYNGTIVSYLDHTQKLVIEKKQSDSAQNRNAKTHRDQFIPQSFFDRNPFERELLAPKMSIAGTIEVGGEKCQVIKLEFPATQRESLIAISMLDKLPRRMEQVAKIKEGSASFVVELTELKIVSDLDASKWQVSEPDGYKRRTEADNPAPAIAPAPQPMTPNQPPAPLPAVNRGGLEPGAAAPAFELEQASGGKFSLSEQKGQVVVVGFWGAMFGASKNTLTVLEETHKDLAGKPVKVVGIACRTDKAAAEKFFADSKATFPSLLGGDDIAKQFKVRGYPSVAVITGEGRVSAFFQSSPTKEELAKAIEVALGGK